MAERTSATAVAPMAQNVQRRGFRQTVFAAARKLGRPLAVPLAIAELRSRTRQAESLSDKLDLAFGFERLGIDFRPWQVRSEIEGLLEAVAAIEPRTILEIGTSNGGSLFLWAQVASPDALIVSVDLPHGEFGGGYPNWRRPLYRSFARRPQRLRLIRADSHDPRTLGKVEEVLGGRQIDFLFIDGDHTYEGAKRDFEMYAPLVREGGLIAFHDIVPEASSGPGREPPPGMTYCGGQVPELWRELRQSRDVREFVADWDSGSFGIGLVTKT